MTQFTHLIYSKVHSRGGEMLWWRPNGAGYTRDVESAGRYLESEAKEAQRITHSDNIAISEADAKLLTREVVVDLGFGRNRDILQSIIERTL